MSHQTPEELKYTKEHEWAKLEGELVTLGITDFAQQALGDIVFVELPEVGRSLAKEESFGVVESIKSVSDLYAPVAGEVVETNSSLESQPESVNANPYDSWMIKIKITDSSQFQSLLNAGDYKDHCENS